MALIKCPECGREISDKANVCIGCGLSNKRTFRGGCKRKSKRENEKIELEREIKYYLIKFMY